MPMRKHFVTSFRPNRRVVQRFVAKQSHCLLKRPISAAKMRLRFSGAPLT
jgi:hypothetical protein